MAAMVLIVTGQGRTFHGVITAVLADGQYSVGSPTSGIHLMVYWVHTYSDWKTGSANYAGSDDYSSGGSFGTESVSGFELVEASRCRLPPVPARFSGLRMAEFSFVLHFITLLTLSLLGC